MTNGIEKYYNEETGQHLLIVDSETHYVGSFAQQEAQRRFAIQSEGGRKEKFFFNGMERLDYVIEALTSAQCGYLLVLSSYIDFGGLIVKSENDKVPMSTTDMQRVLKITKTQQSSFYDFLDACLSHGIITDSGDGRFYVTKQFHFRGKTEGDRVVMTMITKLREMYAEVSAHDIGLLYRLIPYIHKDSNMLCANPEENSPKHVRKFNRKQLAEAIGVSPELISRATGRMVYRGKSVFAKVTTATDGTYYMLNPQVFRRSNVDYDVTVRTIFGLD
ncbi:hypothetical protein I2483_13685 [Sporosarcina sp. E16_3]|uniref:hypothetical protein n=1 Tax=Sporosarcina sp. E16_3 TaxID=2789293 RepID=UPI001A92F040|nr:hypothetical protein [Sporosarcina sp. E16_3]MBO0602714.1 hypothetical protein [Sporosarcina sp. E16_3]